MLVPTPWKNPPADFKEIVWKGDGDTIHDAPAVLHQESAISVFKLELSDNDRRQLIEGNPLYLSMRGVVIPFSVTPNLGEVLDLVR